LDRGWKCFPIPLLRLLRARGLAAAGRHLEPGPDIVRLGDRAVVLPARHAHVDGPRQDRDQTLFYPSVLIASERIDSTDLATASIDADALRRQTLYRVKRPEQLLDSATSWPLEEEMSWELFGDLGYARKQQRLASALVHENPFMAGRHTVPTTFLMTLRPLPPEWLDDESFAPARAPP